MRTPRDQGHSLTQCLDREKDRVGNGKPMLECTFKVFLTYPELFAPIALHPESKL